MLNRSGRESYGEEAIGYVQLKRDGKKVIVKGRITPEQKVRQTPYHVEIHLCDESGIENTHCNCTASLGGCKHVYAFCIWLQRQSDTPSCTEVKCYWKKPRLSTIGKQLKSIKAKELSSKKPETSSFAPSKTSNFMLEVMEATEKHSVRPRGQIFKYFENFYLTDVYLDIIIYKFISKFLDTSFVKFSDFMCNFFNDKVCSEVENSTRAQNEISFWHKVRFGRITASKVYELSRCKTPDGSLVERVICAKKLKDNKYMARGRRLEPEVRKRVEEILQQKIKLTGFHIYLKEPLFGASPDGMLEDSVIEIKCPCSAAAQKNYIVDNKISNKFRAQVQLQMKVCGKKNAFFCVADENFEENKIVRILF